MKSNPRQLAFAFLSVLLVVTHCRAQGWNDYSLEMSNGYEFTRASDINTTVTSPRSGDIIFMPADFDQVGPIREYATSAGILFLHNSGRKPRNLFEGDGVQFIDESIDFFFVIPTADDTVIGPLTSKEFRNFRFPGSTTAELKWVTPANPWVSHAAKEMSNEFERFILILFGLVSACAFLFVVGSVVRNRVKG